MTHDVTKMSDAELREGAQLCTEFSCIYHGIYNMELRRRGAER